MSGSVNNLLCVGDVFFITMRRVEGGLNLILSWISTELNKIMLFCAKFHVYVYRWSMSNCTSFVFVYLFKTNANIRALWFCARLALNIYYRVGELKLCECNELANGAPRRIRFCFVNATVYSGWICVECVKLYNCIQRIRTWRYKSVKLIWSSSATERLVSGSNTSNEPNSKLFMPTSTSISLSSASWVWFGRKL